MTAPGKVSVAQRDGAIEVRIELSPAEVDGQLDEGAVKAQLDRHLEEARNAELVKQYRHALIKHFGWKSDVHPDARLIDALNNSSGCTSEQHSDRIPRLQERLAKVERLLKDRETRLGDIMDGWTSLSSAVLKHLGWKEDLPANAIKAMLEKPCSQAGSDDDPLAEARMWARHGYEIGQRSCTWSDHGVAPKWLTEGWPKHFGKTPDQDVQ